jgi:hypothetical protein
MSPHTTACCSGDADSCARDAFDIGQSSAPGFLGADDIEHLWH